MNAFVPALKRCYQAWIDVLRYAQPVFLLLLRLMIGWGFLIPGIGKLSDPADAARRFQEYGVPLPGINAYLAGTTETVCGVLLILGAASRIITIPLVVTMIVAYATAHKDVFYGMWKDFSSFSDFVIAFNAAPAFAYLVAALIVLLFGPGVLSVDGLLKRVYFDKKCGASGAKRVEIGAAPTSSGMTT